MIQMMGYSTLKSNIIKMIDAHLDNIQDSQRIDENSKYWLVAELTLLKHEIQEKC